MISNIPSLQFENVVKSYPMSHGQRFTVLEKFNLTIYRGEFVSVIGHSGCGKSTALMMAAGLNEITDGYIFLKNKQVTTPGTDRGIVFQSPSLLPWLTVLENILVGVNRVYPNASRKKKEDVAKYYLNRVGLIKSINQQARDLSTGMKQRVAIARAFAIRPKVLLLDEPFGMLDSMTRMELQDVLMDIWSKDKITTMMVTHDIDEAIFLSDRVVMMTNGPHATVGDILKVPFPRPRIRKEIVDREDYYSCRGYLTDFLSDPSVRLKEEN